MPTFLIFSRFAQGIFKLKTYFRVFNSRGKLHTNYSYDVNIKFRFQKKLNSWQQVSLFILLHFCISVLHNVCQFNIQEFMYDNIIKKVLMEKFLQVLGNIKAFSRGTFQRRK